MKLQKLIMGRVVNILSFLYASLMAFICIYMQINNLVPDTFGPIALYLIPSIHVLTSIILIPLIIKDNMLIKFFLFQIESCVAIYTGFETLGMFLFYSSIFLMYIFYFSDKEHTYSVLIFFVIHLFFIFIDPCATIFTKIINIASSIYMMIMFIYCYSILRNKFSSFIPKAVTVNSNIANKKPGELLKLTDYNLTERQINFVYDYIINNLSYKTLSEKYFVSISTVKKEFTDIYKVFGVNKLEELHILLLQYKLEK